MPVDSLEYDGHEQERPMDRAKSALYGQLLCLDEKLPDLLDITSQDCDLNPNELTIHMRIGSVVDDLKLCDMTCKDEIVMELAVKIRVKMSEKLEHFAFGSVENTQTRTVHIGHDALRIALEQLSFENRALIVSSVCNIMQDDWCNKLEMHGRFDLKEHFTNLFADFRHNLLHSLVEA